MNTLLHFKQGVIDPSSLLSSWFPELDWCQWIGVKCDNTTSRVTKLNLACRTNHSKVVALLEKDDKSKCLSGYNSLTGKIPHSMGSLPNLRFLYLESNKFGGEVPSSLKNCKNLTILGLGHNNLSGVIPSWLGQNVKGLKLRFNQFSGNVPTQLCQLHSVMVMDFASNRLSGPIPNCLHNITATLSSNASTREVGYTTHFAGFSIPITCSITMLIKGNELEIFNLMNIFDLSSNNLSGTVPLEMYMLTGLKSLNLSHNHLMGTIPQEVGNFWNH
ncbi:hypothetical protein JHK86_042603 [Glycine max]|nr:hypothetical protein JHK86_042603 [Glycine max]